MKYSRAIVDKASSKLQSGYTLLAYAYTTSSPYYDTSTTAVYTFTGDGNGLYYIECSETFKATLVVQTPNGSTLTFTAWTGIIIEGDNQPTIMPEGST